jgi:hypothetical protein
MPFMETHRGPTLHLWWNRLERFLILIGFLALRRTLTGRRTAATVNVASAIGTASATVAIAASNLRDFHRRPASCSGNLIGYHSNLGTLLTRLAIFPARMLEPTRDKNTITLAERFNYILCCLFPASDVKEVWFLLPLTILLEPTIPSQTKSRYSNPRRGYLQFGISRYIANQSNFVTCCHYIPLSLCGDLSQPLQ